jgi:hypothetical protein
MLDNSKLYLDIVPIIIRASLQMDNRFVPYFKKWNKR